MSQPSRNNDVVAGKVEMVLKSQFFCIQFKDKAQANKKNFRKFEGGKDHFQIKPNLRNLFIICIYDIYIQLSRYVASTIHFLKSDV